MMEPHIPSSERAINPKLEMQREASPARSCVSLKSNWSMDDPPQLSSDAVPFDPMLEMQREASPARSCVSLKSNWSMDDPPQLSSDAVPFDPMLQTQRPASPVLSFLSMRRNWFMDDPSVFSDDAEASDPNMLKKAHSDLAALLNECVMDTTRQRSQAQRAVSPPLSWASMKNEQVTKDSPELCSEAVASVQKKDSTGAAVHAHLQQHSSHSMYDVIDRHKSSMKNKYESFFEGNMTEKNKTLLNKIYVNLYIIEGESEGRKEEHEVLQMEKTPRKHLQDTPINCNDIFKIDPSFEKNRHDQDGKLRTVLTKGIAGIGKTVSVQKFILDWAEGKANQDMHFMFVLPFRELNLITDDLCSLHGLLTDFYPELQGLDSGIYDVHKVLFIFDGLDESRIPLNFAKGEFAKVSDVTMKTSVNVLMANLIRGDLLPSAQIWITSRPAATSQIPSQYVDRMTEIQGFSDSQKEEYFKKRISDQDQAIKIISHIKTAKSLHIMCHIPVFCWISATVLQQIFNDEIPKTLTEMYIHFLIIQINTKKQKYGESTEADLKEQLNSNREVIVKLSELAFKQLMKGNVMFYEEDLRECGIDVIEASVYSGICTEIFKEERVIHQRKIYCFVHLSFQEFLAALYVFHCYMSKNMEELQFFKPQYREWTESVPLEELLEGAVRKSLESKNGHLDLFLRFLLGISLDSNQKLLEGILSHTQSSSESIDKITSYIQKQIKGADEIDTEMLMMMKVWTKMMEKLKQRKCLPTEKLINLYLCLTEMNDKSLTIEIQEFLKSEKHSENKLSPGQCSAIACMLLISEEVLDVLDLKKYNTSVEGYRRLIPALSNCRKALLASCNLSMNTCEIISSALQSPNSTLKELDLSENDLQDSGLEKLSAGLNSSQCKLEILRLAGCNLTANSCGILCSSLTSENSCLKELDVSNNYLQDSGLEVLSEGLKSSHCSLQRLRLDGCCVTAQSIGNLCTALQLQTTCLKELDLSRNDLQDAGVQLLSDGLKNSHCKLEIIRLATCKLNEQSCDTLRTVLQSESSSLKVLDLSNNDLQDSGVGLLSAGLETLHCKLQTLRLAMCKLSEQSCGALKSILQLENSSLKELDVSNNDLQDTGVELLSPGLKSPHCKLEILRFAGCNLTEQSLKTLSAALLTKNSLKELDISNNDLQDIGAELLSAGLKSSHCKLEILRLSCCKITEKGCSSLASALNSNPSHLKELDLTYNYPGESGGNLLSATLKIPHCSLNTLRLEHGGKIRMQPKPKKYSCELTMDPNTAHTRLSLCDENRKVVCGWKPHSYYDHPERFDVYQQVLCRESLTGRCYWEAEWTGPVTECV
ncbi:hypothetical protein NFI96_022232 [Prochilodus magdalenae]|nr:hypothetical protein NFI96_022232 [Prochilodus magdalenae]